MRLPMKNIIYIYIHPHIIIYKKYFTHMIKQLVIQRFSYMSFVLLHLIDFPTPFTSNSTHVPLRRPRAQYYVNLLAMNLPTTNH